MYELWGGGGAPFKRNKDGTLSDKAGRVQVHKHYSGTIIEMDLKVC